ncbi:MAG: MFS transporter [Granulosicoccus sp.]
MQRSPFLLPVLLVCSSLTVMAGATISPGLPGLLAHFADHPDADYLVRFIVTVPGLAIALTAPIAGFIADKLGRRILLQVGVGLYIVAGTAGLWVDDLVLLLASRLLLGAAVGIVMVCSMALLTDHFQGSERDRAMGIQASAMSAGGIVFIAAGSILADVSWRAPFAVYLIPIILFPLIYWFVAKPPVNIEEAAASVEQFPKVHGGLIYCLGFLSMALFYIIPTQLPFFAIELGADSLKYAGFAVVLNQIFASIASAFFQRLRRHLGNRQILLLSFVLLSIGFCLLSQSRSLTMMFVSMPLIGLGLGLNFPNLSIWLMSRVPSTMRGRASGGLTTSIFLGQFLSPLISQPIVNTYNLGTAYLFAAAAMLIIVVLPTLVTLLLWPERNA